MTDKSNKNIIHYDKLKMGVDDDIKCSDDFKYSYEDGMICSFCGGIYKKSYITNIYNSEIKTKACFCCNVVCNFKSHYMGKCMLVISTLSQYEINLLTLDKFNEQDTIPLPINIDKKCQFVTGISLFEFMICYNKMTSIQKESFNNFKIMFTCEAKSSLQGCAGFNKFLNNKNEINNNSNDEDMCYNISYFDIKKYKIKKYQLDIINIIKQNIKIQEDKIILEIKTSLDNKVKETKTICKLLNKLN